MPESPAEVLRAAATKLDDLASFATTGPWEAVHEGLVNGHGWRFLSVGDDDSGDQHDVEWAAVMGPQVAPALSAWLRAEADDAQMVTDQNAAADARAARLGGINGQTYVMARHTLTHALAFARALLGEDTPDA